MEEPRKTGLAWLRTPFTHAAIMVRERAVEPAGCAFFAPDFALSDPEPWLIGEEAPLDLVAAPLPGLSRRADPSSAEFARMHEEILARIQSGEFEKVVPIVCEELEFAEPLRAEMFSEAVLAPKPGQFAFGFEFRDEGLCGVTPELLFSVKKGELNTMALAGTGVAGGPSLLDDPKERLEHQLVIDHIAGELSPWGVPEIGETQERVYGVLKHLYTPIKLRLQEPADFMRLVVRLHPTAALGGWPRRPAVEWLEKQDFHFARKRFGAPFGFTRGEEMCCVVAIRCLQWWGTRALLSSGCGVVKGSESIREWKELQLKRRATESLLGLN